MVKTDAVNEEYILADEHYESTKQLVKSKIGLVGHEPTALNLMIEQFEEARIRFKNAAMELTRLELQNSKKLIGESVLQQKKTLRIEQEVQNIQSGIQSLESEISVMRERIVDAQQTSEKIRLLKQERDSLKSTFDRLNTERFEIEATSSDLEDSMKPIEGLRRDIRKTVEELQAATMEIEQLQNELSEVAVLYEETEPERARNLSEKERLHKEFDTIKLTITKLQNDIFLAAGDLDRRQEAIESTRRAIADLVAEKEEVKNFPVVQIEPVDLEANRLELEEMENERQQLSFEIERIREERLRQRMKI
jgi:chromosome segregation ATPase